MTCPQLVGYRIKTNQDLSDVRISSDTYCSCVPECPLLAILNTGKLEKLNGAHWEWENEES